MEDREASRIEAGFRCFGDVCLLFTSFINMSVNHLKALPISSHFLLWFLVEFTEFQFSYCISNSCNFSLIKYLRGN